MKIKVNTLLFFLLISSYSYATTLKIPSMPDGNHQFYHELLQESLRAEGSHIKIEDAGEIPHKRVLHLLDNGSVSIYWLIQKNERDKRWVPVKFGLTNGLIGCRLLFIPSGDQRRYVGVKTLTDFQKLNLTGAFGKGWFDVGVWKLNDLKYHEVDGNWRRIYTMLGSRNRGIDYFSRGFNEIIKESKEVSYLRIEKRLMFVYKRDYIFYLSKSLKHFQIPLEKALKSAKRKGLLERLIQKYWGKYFKKLNFDERVKIKLKAPK